MRQWRTAATAWLIWTLVASGCSGERPAVLDIATTTPLAASTGTWEDRTADAAPTPEAAPARPEPNFGLRFEYGCLEPTRVLNTFNETLVQDTYLQSSPVTITLTLSPETQQTLYEEITAIDFFDYPSEFSIQLRDDQERVITAPYMVYRLLVRNGAQTNDVRWKDDIFAPTPDQAERLRRLFRHIKTIIEEQPELKQLPPLPGCA
jgi:hypothetical protein